MDLSEASMSIWLPSWVSCTALLVHPPELPGYPQLVARRQQKITNFIFSRFRCIRSPSSRNLFLRCSTLVVPLHCISRHRWDKHYRPLRSFSRKNSRRSVRWSLSYIVAYWPLLYHVNLELLSEAGQEPVPAEPQTEAAQKGKYQQILSLKAVHFLALFTIIYIGVEVTVGGEPVLSQHINRRSDFPPPYRRLDRHFYHPAKGWWS